MGCRRPPPLAQRRETVGAFPLCGVGATRELGLSIRSRGVEFGPPKTLRPSWPTVHTSNSEAALIASISARWPTARRRRSSSTTNVQPRAACSLAFGTAWISSLRPTFYARDVRGWKPAGGLYAGPALADSTRSAEAGCKEPARDCRAGHLLDSERRDLAMWRSSSQRMKADRPTSRGSTRARNRLRYMRTTRKPGAPDGRTAAARTQAQETVRILRFQRRSPLPFAHDPVRPRRAKACRLSFSFAIDATAIASTFEVA